MTHYHQSVDQCWFSPMTRLAEECQMHYKTGSSYHLQLLCCFAKAGWLMALEWKIKMKVKKKDQPLFLLIDVIVGDIKIKLQAQILKLYVLQTTAWTTFSKGHLDWKCKWNPLPLSTPATQAIAVYPAEASCSKLGLVQNVNADMKA